MSTLTIDAMNLLPNTKRAAEIIQQQHPSVEFTSGRRGARDQARAMAQNVVAVGPSWVFNTYNAKQPKMVSVMMTHMEEHPDRAKQVSLLTEDFHDILTEYFLPAFMKFPHFQGRAFDIRWPRFPRSGEIDFAKGEQICYTIANLKDTFRIPLELLLKRESGVFVIHSQYIESPLLTTEI